MDKTTIIINKEMKLKDPVLVVGLPGIGNVGKLIAEHLKKEYKPVKLATMYSPHFPHQVVMLKGGGIRLVGNRFYAIKAKGKRDIVLLTGETQAVSTEGQYDVNHEIVKFFKSKLGGKFIYTLGGYSVSRNMSQQPKVYANVTRKRILPRFKNSGMIFGKSRGMILGSAGLILAFAKMEKMDGICLMGETSFLDVDAAAAKAVLKVLAKELDLEIKTENLDKLIDKTAKAVKELEQQAAGFGVQEGGAAAGHDKPAYIR